MELSSKLTVAIPFWESKDKRRAELASFLFQRLNCYWSTPDLIGGVRYIVGGPEHRARSRNWLVDQVQTPYVLMLDADTIPEKFPVEQGVALLDAGVPWVIPYGEGKYYNLTQESSDRLLRSDPCGPISGYTYEHRLTSWAGALLFRKEDFNRMGGYDERFQGWGHEDVAFMIKFDHDIGPHSRVPGRVFHLWHEKGEDNFGSPQELANRELFEKEYKRKYKWRDPR